MLESPKVLLRPPYRSDAGHETTLASHAVRDLMRKSVRTVPLFLVIALLAVMAGIPSAASAQTGGGPSVTMSLVSPTVQVRINSPLSVKAAFSEPVSGFSVDDIAVANGAAGNFTGSDGGAVYTFDVTPDAVGTVTVEIAAGAAGKRRRQRQHGCPSIFVGYSV